MKTVVGRSLPMHIRMRKRQHCILSTPPCCNCHLCSVSFSFCTFNSGLFLCPLDSLHRFPVREIWGAQKHPPISPLHSPQQLLLLSAVSLRAWLVLFFPRVLGAEQSLAFLLARSSACPELLRIQASES